MCLIIITVHVLVKFVWIYLAKKRDCVISIFESRGGDIRGISDQGRAKEYTFCSSGLQRPCGGSARISCSGFKCGLQPCMYKLFQIPTPYYGFFHKAKFT